MNIERASGKVRIQEKLAVLYCVYNHPDSKLNLSIGLEIIK